MRKVFVPNRNPLNPHDYSGAWDFGELVFCTQGDLHRLDIVTMQAELEKAMQDADEEDYILVSSLASLCSIACAIFANRFGCLNLLLFDNGKYHARSITLAYHAKGETHAD